MGTRSDITPSRGLETATVAVDMATPRLHIELAVKVTPRNTVPSPSASLNKSTK